MDKISIDSLTKEASALYGRVGEGEFAVQDIVTSVMPTHDAGLIQLLRSSPELLDEEIGGRSLRHALEDGIRSSVCREVVEDISLERLMSSVG